MGIYVTGSSLHPDMTFDSVGQEMFFLRNPADF